MAKIDISTIEGYEEMTAEEKLAALESMEIPEPDFTGYVKKELLDKASSEAANFKKQLREKMTEEEAAKAKAAEDMASMQEELAQLRQEKIIQEYTAQFLSIGYDKELALETAEALEKGDMHTVFLNQTRFSTAREKALKAELLKDTPKPPAGSGGPSAAEFQQKIAEAQASGDFTAVAYYTRLAAQASQN